MDNFMLRFILAQMQLPNGMSPDDFLTTVHALHQQLCAASSLKAVWLNNWAFPGST